MADPTPLAPVPEVPQPSDHSPLKFLPLTVVIILLAIGGAWWAGYIPWFGSLSLPTQYTTETTPFDTLMQGNSAFAEAEALMKAERYQEAILKYQEALGTATDTVQEGQIKFKIARATEESGDVRGAITLLKELARDKRYINFVRAYSVQSLGMLLLKPEGVQYGPVVFSGEPYSAMVVEGERSLTLRHLFEHASSIYPLALPELFIATWYADALIAMQEKGIDDAAMREQYLTIIQQKMASAEKDIARISADENERLLMPEVYKRKTNILGKLAALSEGDVGVVEQAYIEAMNVHAALGPGEDGYMRYYYARFLSGLDNRSEDVRRVLAPFYTGSVYKDHSVTRFFRQEKNNQFLQKNAVASLAGIDPAFKEFLISLGWTATDFQ